MNNYYGRNGSVPETLLNDCFISRDYSLTEQQDYNKNILPYRKRGYVIEPIVDHRYGYTILTSWRVLGIGANKGSL